MTDTAPAFEQWRDAMEQRRVLLAENNLKNAPKQSWRGEGADLRQKAFARWGTRCPCCEVPMHDKRKVDGQKMTVGHDGSVDAGGAPRWRWIFICHRCNQEQGKFRFHAWAYLLLKNGDRRGPAVARAAFFLDEEAGLWPKPRT